MCEDGHISIDANGRVIVSQAVSSHCGLAAAVNPLRGQTSLAHNPATAGYFDWHLMNKYQRR